MHKSYVTKRASAPSAPKPALFAVANPPRGIDYQIIVSYPSFVAASYAWRGELTQVGNQILLAKFSDTLDLCVYKGVPYLKMACGAELVLDAKLLRVKYIVQDFQRSGLYPTYETHAVADKLTKEIAP